MEKLMVSSDSLWFKLAVLGGWRGHLRFYDEQLNTCSFFGNVVKACIVIFIGSILLFCSATDLILLLISLGLPTAVSGWMVKSVLVRLIVALGVPILLVVWIILFVFLAALIAVCIKSLTRYAFGNLVYALSSKTHVWKSVKDYLHGICKPVEIVD